MIVAAIPAYNEEKSIAKVVVRTKKHVDKVIVCDDGSADATAEIAAALGAEVLRHERNSGKGDALRDLFLRALQLNPEVVVTIDADGQHDADEIPKLVASIREGADIVVGTRFSGDIPRMRRVGNAVLGSASGTGVSDTQSGFRAYRGDRIGDLVPTEMGMGVDTEVLKIARDKGMKIVEVPISISYAGETSTHNPIYHGLDVLLSTVKQTSIRHALLFYGTPGLLCLMVAVGLWWDTLDHFVRFGALETNFAIVAVAATFVGFLFLSVAVILWVLISVIRESRR